MLVKLSDAVGYAKNPENKAIVNVDNNALQSYKAARENRRRQEETLNSLKKENVELKNLLQNVIQCSFNIAEITNEQLIEIERKTKGK